MGVGIEVNSPFNVGAPVPIDGRLVLTKQEMLQINDAIMPSTYFCICKDDGGFYLYNKASEINEETGKFKFIFDNAGSGIDESEILKLLDENVATKDDIDNIIDTIQTLIDNVPEDLDTLKEITDAITELRGAVKTLEDNQLNESITNSDIDDIFS